MKHVKRILVSLMFGLFMGVFMGLSYRFLQNSETWFNDAFLAGWFSALGYWFGIGMKFFHKDE